MGVRGGGGKGALGGGKEGGRGEKSCITVGWVATKLCRGVFNYCCYYFWRAYPIFLIIVCILSITGARQKDVSG